MLKWKTGTKYFPLKCVEVLDSTLCKIFKKKAQAQPTLNDHSHTHLCLTPQELVPWTRTSTPLVQMNVGRAQDRSRQGQWLRLAHWLYHTLLKLQLHQSGGFMQKKKWLCPFAHLRCNALLSKINWLCSKHGKMKPWLLWQCYLLFNEAQNNLLPGLVLQTVFMVMGPSSSIFLIVQ